MELSWQGITTPSDDSVVPNLSASSCWLGRVRSHQTRDFFDLLVPIAHDAKHAHSRDDADSKHKVFDDQLLNCRWPWNLSLADVQEKSQNCACPKDATRR